MEQEVGGKTFFFCSEMLKTFFYFFLDMVQFDQYDSSPTVSVEPEVTTEVNVQLVLRTE